MGILRGIISDIKDIVIWLRNPLSWRILGLLCVFLLLCFGIFWFSLSGTELNGFFTLCRSSSNTVILTEFFAFTFFGLFGTVAVGEITNRVDRAKKKRLFAIRGWNQPQIAQNGLIS